MRRRRSCGICSGFPPSPPPHCSLYLPSPETLAPSEFSPDFFEVIFCAVKRNSTASWILQSEGSAGRSYVLLWASPRLVGDPLPPRLLPSSSPLHRSPPSSLTHPLGCNSPGPPGSVMWRGDKKVSLMKALLFLSEIAKWEEGSILTRI